jgi:transcriptional regulator with XRE-family HTH domain
MIVSSIDLSSGVTNKKKRIRVQIDKKRFGEHLATLRERVPLTQQELADAVGLTLRGLQNLEYGGSVPGHETLIKLADALGITPGELFMHLAGRTEDSAENQLIERLRQTIREYEAQKRGLEVEKKTPPLNETMKESLDQIVPGAETIGDMGEQGYVITPKKSPETKNKSSQKIKQEPEKDK